MIITDNIINLLSAVIALVGLIFIIIEIRNNNKISAADFIYRLREDFYSEQSKCIMFFIKRGLIKYKDDEDYFLLDEKTISKLDNKFKSHKNFAEVMNYIIHIQDMDDYVLGYLNDIGEYRKKHIIRLDYIVNSFREPFRTLYKNVEMKGYIEKYNDEYRYIKEVAEKII